MSEFSLICLSSDLQLLSELLARESRNKKSICCDCSTTVNTFTDAGINRVRCVTAACSRFYLVLELARVSTADGDHAAIDVQLTYDGHARLQLSPERLRRAAAKPQQPDQDVLLRVLVRQEGLPAIVSHIVPPDQLHLQATRTNQ